jgi:4-alpha-glucanotransferase
MKTRRRTRLDSEAKRLAVIPAPVRFGRAICGDLDQAERREWWLTNGLGAYAASTVADTLTRRYHGLLIAPIDPPLGRRLVFTKADATLVASGRSWPLHSNRWGDGVIEPSAFSNIEAFHFDGAMPVWKTEGRRCDSSGHGSIRRRSAWQRRAAQDRPGRL